MELGPGHKASLLSKKSGACLDIEVMPPELASGTIVVRTQDIEASITITTEGIRIETDGEILIGRYEEDE